MKGPVMEHEIVEAIIDDLMSRKGLGDEWDQIDDDIQGEIREAWVAIVRAALKPK